MPKQVNKTIIMAFADEYWYILQSLKNTFVNVRGKCSTLSLFLLCFLLAVMLSSISAFLYVSPNLCFLCWSFSLQPIWRKFHHCGPMLLLVLAPSYHPSYRKNWTENRAQEQNGTYQSTLQSKENEPSGRCARISTLHLCEAQSCCSDMD